jgi:hypothetical protein
MSQPSRARKVPFIDRREGACSYFLKFLVRIVHQQTLRKRKRFRVVHSDRIEIDWIRISATQRMSCAFIWKVTFNDTGYVINYIKTAKITP